MSYTHETIERFNTARARMMRPKAVRALPLTALRSFEAAARHAKARLRSEVEALAADPEDRAEAARVLRDMEQLRAW